MVRKKKEISSEELPPDGGLDCKIEGGDFGSPPIMDSQKVVKLTLRVTTSEISLNTMYSGFMNFLSEYKWILAVEKEGTPSQHFHAVICIENNQTKSEDAWRLIFFKIFDFVCLCKKVSKSGTESYPYSISWDRGKAESYTVKDQNFKSNMYTKIELEEFSKTAYKKFTKNEFADQLHKIEDEYLKDDNKSLRWFIVEFLKLKVSYKQIIDLHYIAKYARMIHLKKEDYFVDYANKVIEIIEQGPIRTWEEKEEFKRRKRETLEYHGFK